MKRIMWITLLIVGTLGMGYAEEPVELDILVFGGGTHHEFQQLTESFLIKMMGTENWQGSYLYTEDTDYLKSDSLENYDVLLMYCCSFYPISQYDNKPMPEHIPKSLTEFVAHGGGMVALHSTVASFDEWEDFIDLIGGVWVWGTSAHDRYQTMTSEVVAEHPVVQGLPKSFSFKDEFYHTLRIKPDCEILIEGTHEKDGEEVTEPLAWIAPQSGEGRVVTLLHGHDHVSWNNPSFQQLLKQAVEWTAHKN